jgi:hypothetical protein
MTRLPSPHNANCKDLGACFGLLTATVFGIGAWMLLYKAFAG